MGAAVKAGHDGRSAAARWSGVLFFTGSFGFMVTPL